MPTPVSIDKFTIQMIDHDGVENILKSFNARRLKKELTILQRKNSKYLLRHFRRAFKTQSDPATGRRWAPLSPFTIRRRRFKNRPILTQTGALRRSLDYKIKIQRSNVIALIGTQYPTALIHQAGKSPNVSKIGNQRILYRDIPARPFVGMNEKFEKRIKNNLLHFMKQKVRPQGSERLSTSRLPFSGMSKDSGLTGRWGMRS